MSNPTKLPELEVREAASIIALAKGEATEDQQKEAFQVIIEKLSGMYGFHYYPESSRETDFSLGKAFVGQMMVGIVKSGTEPYRQLQQRKGNGNVRRDTPGSRPSNRND